MDVVLIGTGDSARTDGPRGWIYQFTRCPHKLVFVKKIRVYYVSKFTLFVS